MLATTPRCQAVELSAGRGRTDGGDHRHRADRHSSSQRRHVALGAEQVENRAHAADADLRRAAAR